MFKSLDFNSIDGYTLMDGTSMATPLVTGAIALMLSKDPDLTPAQIDEILEHTAVKLTEHKSNDFGSGLLDALAAVNAVPTGDGLSENALNVSIFPNPTRDKVTVQCEGMKQIEVYAMDGRLVKCLVVSGSECLIEGLSSGVYLVKIETNKETITKKIVKM